MRVQARSYKMWSEKKERKVVIIIIVTSTPFGLVYISMLEIVGRLDKGYI